MIILYNSPRREADHPDLKTQVAQNTDPSPDFRTEMEGTQELRRPSRRTVPAQEIPIDSLQARRLVRTWTSARSTARLTHPYPVLIHPYRSSAQPEVSVPSAKPLAKPAGESNATMTLSSTNAMVNRLNIAHASKQSRVKHRRE